MEAWESIAAEIKSKIDEASESLDDDAWGEFQDAVQTLLDDADEERFAELDWGSE